ncbi:MAG: TIGR00725 family protein [Myxococcales bacterium]|nr:TIGR00725 family protein [Myxococcales bacterium]
MSETNSPRHRKRRPQVAIIGGGEASPAELAAAEGLGRGLVDRGYRLVTGGLGGVMTAASRGGSQARGWFEGAVVGILPTADAATGNQWLDVVIPTGLGHGRNLLVVASADLVIAVGGGAGTLSELALAWVHRRPLIALDLGTGWSSRLAGAALDDRRDDRILRAGDVDAALALAEGALSSSARSMASRP